MIHPHMSNLTKACYLYWPFVIFKAGWSCQLIQQTLVKTSIWQLSPASFVTCQQCSL